MKKAIIILLLLGVISLFFYYTNSFWKKTDTLGGRVVVSTSTVHRTIAPKVGLGNPAAINCGKLGGNSVIEKRGDGGEFGLCYFEENRACEEWALLRGECPVGGRKTTGYDTRDQNYCVWLGGETLAVKNSQCTFKNGKVCFTIDLYNGKCSQNK